MKLSRTQARIASSAIIIIVVFVLSFTGNTSIDISNLLALLLLLVPIVAVIVLVRRILGTSPTDEGPLWMRVVEIVVVALCCMLVIMGALSMLGSPTSTTFQEVEIAP